MPRLSLALSLFALLAAGCSSPSPRAPKPAGGLSTTEPAAAASGPAAAGDAASEMAPSSPGALLVLVASSVREPMEALVADWSAGTGVPVKVSSGASNTLARQIEEGAPAHLFLSANLEWAKELRTKGLSMESAPLLGNQLVVVVPKGQALANVKDLTGAGVEHLALAGEEVPAGKYAQQSLTSLGLWDDLQAPGKIVRGADVRATLAYVEQGEAEAGIVYATDAAISDKVDVAFTLDGASHDPLVYPLVLLEAARDRRDAKSLFEYLQGEAAWVVFQRYRFSRAEAAMPVSP